MKKLMVSVFALTALASGAMAAEPLTSSQLDQVTAGWGSTFQINANFTHQYAASQANGGCVVALCGSAFGGNGNASSGAANYNSTGQANVSF